MPARLMVPSGPFLVSFSAVLPHFLHRLRRPGEAGFLEVVEVVEQRPAALPPRHAPGLALAADDLREDGVDDLRVVDDGGQVGGHGVERLVVEVMREDVVVQGQEIGAVAGGHRNRQLGLVFMQIEGEQFDLDVGVHLLESRLRQAIRRRGFAVAEPDRQFSGNRVGSPGGGPQPGQQQPRATGKNGSSFHRTLLHPATWPLPES